MKNNGKKINQSNILILGFAFKENCEDIRNTKVIDIINCFKKYIPEKLPHCLFF